MKKTFLKRVVIAVLTMGLVMANTGGAAAAEPSFSIEKLTVNYRTTPIGIEGDNITFSWQMKSDVIGAAQSAYQIEVFDGENTLWNSGKTESAKSVGIAYAGAPLADAVRYTWRVCVWNSNGESQSAQSYFETAVSHSGDWAAAQFIRTSTSAAAPIFRTEKKLKGAVSSARLYATAIGVYSALVNGSEVYREEGSERIYNHMAPGYSNGALSLDYQTYDITALLKNEEYAVITFCAGVGWSDGTNGVLGNSSGRPAIKAMAVVTYTDGTKDVIKSDTVNWKATLDGAIVANGIFYGEDYDARRVAALGDYTKPLYDTSKWIAPLESTSYSGKITASRAMMGGIVDAFEKGAVSATLYTKNKAQSEFSGGEIDVEGYAEGENLWGEGITIRDGQNMVVDMGQNMTAIPRITFCAASGTRVNIKFAEMLNDGSTVGSGATQASGPKGSIYIKSLRGARSEAVYTFAGAGDETYQPLLSFFGYRYVRIKAIGGTVVVKSLVSRALSSVRTQSGNIETNNQAVNRLFLNTLYGQLSNFFTIPTDCAQRDERLAWSGDAQAFAKTAMYHFDSAAFLGGYQEMLDESTLKKGYPSAVLSLSGYFDHWAAGWSDVEIVNLWSIYTQTGDINILKKSLDAVYRYTDYLALHERAPHCAPAVSKRAYGDWLAYQGTSYEVIADYYYAYVIEIAEKIAQAVGDAAAAEGYRAKFENQKAAFLQNHVTFMRDAEDAKVLSEPTNDNALLVHTFDARSTRFLRFYVTQSGPGTKNDGEYRLQMMEVRAFDGEGKNVALSKRASTDNDFNAYGWSIANLTDGDIGSGYSSKDNKTNDLTKMPITVTIDLGSEYTISRAEVLCRVFTESMKSGVCPNYPKRYTLQTSLDGETWEDVDSYAVTAADEDRLTIHSSIGSGVFMNKGGVFEDNSQTALLWMLKLGFYDGEDMRAEALRLLCENIKNDSPAPSSVRAKMGKNTLSVGFLGSNIIAPVLTEMGKSSLSYDLLLNETCPSWLFEVNAGATTVWERWNSYDPENGFGDAEMNSFNHFAYGSVAEWMYRAMAGIDLDGAESITIAPVTDTGVMYNTQKRIQAVRGRYDSYLGRIETQWRSDEDGALVSLRVRIPANSTAALYLPVTAQKMQGFRNVCGINYIGMREHNAIECAKILLTAGEYTFDCEGDRVEAAVAKSCVLPQKALWSNLNPDVLTVYSIENGGGECEIKYSASEEVTLITVDDTARVYTLKSSESSITLPQCENLFIWKKGNLMPLSDKVSF